MPKFNANLSVQFDEVDFLDRFDCAFTHPTGAFRLRVKYRRPYRS
jgi:hydroxypyruvate isomerase